ncbi:FAD:protein FMN transferase [Thalassomonas sp. M1454]|uniref:FAD:protein FMN transferase n=1 Tax=Thalassomonas sp. M1454 TaxID=2594477 RepID=UPI00118079A7|nr:FAD:protein FMN transferase [Thalassomonas sp. M1454]TRX55775.1 FAD:protein FMN transferase [Thalassomonas sp. M1454]
MIAKLFKSIVILCALTLTFSCSEAEQASVNELKELQLTGYTMGPIVYTVKLVASESTVEQQKLAKQVDDLLIKINAQMSTYDKQSELSLFNQYTGSEPRKTSVELAQVLNESIRLAKLTNGALDVTVGPLVNLWSFGPENRAEQVPSTELITQTKQHIGINKIALADGMLSKSDAKVYVDLSAIAKGFAVDKVAELLENNGYHDYLVDIGGEMRLKGKKTNGQQWRIAVEKPIAGERAVQKVIIPGDNAVATSGDYRNYFEENGVRYSHTIDPETGWPISHKLVSVTVVHPSSMIADGLATAIEVMGPNKGFEFAKANNFAVYLISKSENGFIERSTDQFKQLIAK